MKFQQKVIATDFRSGVSKKDGSNKDRPFISFHCLDSDGRKFDVFQWDDNNRFPKKIDTPCLLVAQFDMGTNQEGDPTLEVLKIEEKSAIFDLGKVIESLKLPMEKVS